MKARISVTLEPRSVAVLVDLVSQMKESTLHLKFDASFGGNRTS